MFGSAQAAQVVEVTSFGSNPGNLQMFKYIPDNLPSNAPLVVALHGANSDHTLMTDTTGWKQLADRFQFALVMPQQKSANQMYKAFNFNASGDNTRGNGETLSIKQMVDNMFANHNLNATRVYVTGFSAGGFMTTVMLAAYPEIFAAGHPYAGGAYPCTKAVSDCGAVVLKTPQQWGDLVRQQNPSYTGPWPRVIVGQGDQDNLDDYAWMQEIVDQWTNVHGIDQTADVSDTIKGYPHKVYKDGSGNSKVETLTITGLSHKMAVDPGTAIDQCGQTSFIASEDKNICMAYWSANFFGLTTSQPPAACNDGVDNDSDGNIDYPADPGCSSAADNDETDAPPPAPACDDGTDNDGDTKVDFPADPGCTSASDTDETDPPPPPPPGGTQLNFNSIDAEDGYVKANNDGSSPEVGTLETTTGLGMGRSTAFPYKHMRTILSFDTSSIPDNSTITRAWLTVTAQTSGGNPWNDPSGNTLVVDLKQGCLGAACSVQTDDWAYAATVHPTSTIAQFSSGSKDSADFDLAGLGMINKTGKTQIKLRFSQFQTFSNYITIYGGGSSNRAVLHVLYQ
jgi:poly(hydroxyalkanoate) depolymerase family esterase